MGPSRDATQDPKELHELRDCAEKSNAALVCSCRLRGELRGGTGAAGAEVEGRLSSMEFNEFQAIEEFIVCRRGDAKKTAQGRSGDRTPPLVTPTPPSLPQIVQRCQG